MASDARGSDRSVFLALLGTLVLAIAALALVSVYGFSVLSSVRAYVAGESQWSKARSRAVAALKDYVVSGAADDHLRFEAALAVPLGDQRARRELDKPEPDMAIARAGFLAGDNAPDDVDGMIGLYRRFRDVPFMRDAVTAWAEGDVLIGELRRLGAQVHEAFRRGAPPAEPAATLSRIEALEEALIVAERRFTASLGRASVATERLLMLLTFALASLLAIAGAIYLRRTLRAQFAQRDALAELARVTAEKQAAERLAQARVAFLSRLSHELRTPLNAVLGLAQLLRIDAGEPLTPAQARRVDIIMDSGGQLLRLVEDVLDITRIDSGTVGLKIAPTDVGATLQASLHLVEPERAAFGVAVDNRVPENGARVMADPQRLQQVFVNLLSNACKYNRRGGRLTIACHDDGPQLGIEIGDEGPGLNEAQQRELFQPFKRLGSANGVAGTGLGLVVVKLLVEQMQGHVSVRSLPGQGAHFMVRMPKVDGLRAEHDGGR